MTALEKMNNFPLAGREVRPLPPSPLGRYQPDRLSLSLSLISHLDVAQIKVGLVADKSAAFSRAEPSGLDDGTGASCSLPTFPCLTEPSHSLIHSGGNLNNISRIELMQKLSRTDRPIDLPMVPMSVLPLPSPPPSPLLLKLTHPSAHRFRPNIPQATTRNV